MAENKPRKRLLFVDDEASIRLTLPPILDKAGFEVHVAERASPMRSSRLIPFSSTPWLPT